MAVTMSATQTPDWQNPEVIEINRCPMTATFETGGNKISLNGVWDFMWYQTPDMRSHDFFKTFA